MFLNFFNITQNTDIFYYKASVLLRNIIEELYNPNISIQKLELLTDRFKKFENYNDKYDEFYKNHVEVSFFIIKVILKI